MNLPTRGNPCNFLFISPHFFVFFCLPGIHRSNESDSRARAQYRSPRGPSVSWTCASARSLWQEPCPCHSLLLNYNRTLMSFMRFNKTSFSDSCFVLVAFCPQPTPAGSSFHRETLPCLKSRLHLNLWLITCPNIYNLGGVPIADCHDSKRQPSCSYPPRHQPLKKVACPKLKERRFAGWECILLNIFVSK